MQHTATATATLAIAVLIAGCSSTPGDAARRAAKPDAAARLYSQGAEQGDGTAALKLGLLLMQNPLPGYGTPGDWFVKGCTTGEIVACHNAGVGYEYAQHGLRKDLLEAARMYRIAASRGYMPSQYNLGSLYSNGYLQGDVEGLTWLLVSQKQARSCLPQPGCQWTIADEPGHVARLRARMSQRDQHSAEEQAANWVSSK